MNKFIVNSSVLLLALQYCGKVISKNPVVPILENFLFSVSNQVLTVTGSDLQTAFKLSWRVECKPDTKFTAVVPAIITKYLQKLELQPITFSWDGANYSIELLEDSGRAKYAGENPQDFPIMPQTNTELFEYNSDLFGELKDLLNYVANDDLRPAMSGIGFLTHEGKFAMVATNGHTLKTVRIPEFDVAGLEKQHFILSSKAAKILSELKFGTAKKPERELMTICGKFDVKEHVKSELKTDFWEKSKAEMYLEFINDWLTIEAMADHYGRTVEHMQAVIDEGKVAHENPPLSHVSFLFNHGPFDMELTVRNIDERFPQYWNVIPETSSTQYTTDKKQFISVLDKAMLFAHKTTHQVRLSLNGVNKISAEDLDFSTEYAAQTGGEYSGNPIEIGFNGGFLKDAVSSFGDKFTLEMTAPNRAAVIRQGNALVLVMPVMLNQYV